MRQIFKCFTPIIFLVSSNLVFSLSWNQKIIQDDSIKVEKFINHVKTLNYISRKNASDPYFLDLTYKYSDSILLIDPENEFASNTKINIDLTRSTIENNVINKFKLFEFYSGIPNYYGFVDDPIEYAYDEAIEKLIKTRYIKLHNGPLSDANITSILMRENCGDEMFEIVNQTLVLNTNHHILQKDELIEVFGAEKTDQIINGKFNDDDAKRLAKELNLERVGVFKVNDLDVINNEIWFVQINFSTFLEKEFTEAIFEKGVSIDKREISFLNLLGSLALNLFLAFYLYLILINIQYQLSIENKTNPFKKLILSIFYGFKSASGQILASLPWMKSIRELYPVNFTKRYIYYLIAPTILSVLMIFITSFLVPNPEVHFLEPNVIIWFVSSILLISFAPLIINLFIINRLNIDGFHTKNGYQEFIAVSLFATQIPFIIFYYIKYGLPNFRGILFEGDGGYFQLTVNSFLVSIILGNAFYEYSSKRKSKFNNNQALISLLIGIVAIIYVNGLLVLGVDKNSMFIFGTSFLILCLIINNYLERTYTNKEKENLKRLENNNKDNWDFVEKVIDVKNQIFNSILTTENNDLNIYIINANQGIGKTRALNQVKKEFLKNNWYWFYGDCDEIQSDSSVTFEPILQAFGSLLNKEKLSDRSEEIDSITSKIVNTAIDSTIGINPISEFKKNSESTIKNICLEITEKLNSLNQKIVITIEDLHWIDSESFAFLKELIKTINRFDSLRKNTSFILTVRSNFNNDRGVNYEKLVTDIDQLNEETENQVSYKDLVSTKDFMIEDFLIELYKKNNEKDDSIRIAKSSVDELNKIFNKLIIENKDKELNVTPLYILNNIKKWIENGTLKLSQDGYILSKSIQIDHMPNFDEIDSFYHDIFDSFDKKWIRLLESATIIGNKFDADILSQVWDYNLLEVLAFLEEAVKKELVIDLSDQDNFYEFKDQRIISSIKSYFKNDLIQFRGEKQIIIEYNKRYLDLVKDIIDQPEKHDVEDVIKVTKRIISLRFLEKYSLKLDKLILDVVLRSLYYQQIEKLSVFGKYLTTSGLEDVGQLIIKLSVIVDQFESTDDKKRKIVDAIIKEQENFNKIPIDYINKSTILNSIRLLILLNADGNRKNFLQTKSLGFSYLSFDENDYQYLIEIFPNKIKGLALLHYVKEFYEELLDYSLIITDFKKDISSPEIDAKLKSLYKQVILDIKKSDFEIIGETEFELYGLNIDPVDDSNIAEMEDEELDEIEGMLQDLGLEEKEKIKNDKNYIENKIDNYDKLFNKIIQENNNQLLAQCLNSFIMFSNQKLKDANLAIKYFRKFNPYLIKDGNVNELWVTSFLKFLLSSCCDCKKTKMYKESEPECNCIKTGEKYIIDEGEEVKNSLILSKDYLSKIIEYSTLSTISNLLFDVNKLYLKLTKNFKELESIFDVHKEKIIKTYSKDHLEYDKFLVNSSIELEKINRNKKAIAYLKESLNQINRKEQHPQRNYLKKSQRYLAIAKNYRIENNISFAEKNILKALEFVKKWFKLGEPKGWQLIDNELIPLEKDKDILFLFGKGERRRVKAGIKNFGFVHREYARILNLKKDYVKSDSSFENAIRYMYEDYMYVQYNYTILEKGINLYNVDKKEAKKVLKNAIKKLKNTNIPENEIDLYNRFKKLIDHDISLALKLIQE